MANLILSLGSNMGDRRKYLELAIIKLKETIGQYIQSSAIYETEPWGNSDQNIYYNEITIFHTSLLPLEVIEKTRMIENELGRVRQKNQYTNRTIDIDILFYDSLIINEKVLKIPHPRISERRFVLVPLNEIMPDFVHPVAKVTIKKLLMECDDKLVVMRINDSFI